jgi:hypothetical protein
MNKFIVLTFTLLCAFSAHADPNEEPLFTPDAIFSVATTDWNNDGIEDPVMILNINDGEQFDVLFFLSDEYGRLALSHHIPDMIWGSSAMFGQEPSVTKTPYGSIIIGSQNSAIGRDRWEQKLTIAYRDNQLILAGFTYSFYDTLDTENYGNCDLNLLTGKGLTNEKSISFRSVFTPLSTYSDQSNNFIDLCQFQ